MFGLTKNRSDKTNQSILFHEDHSIKDVNEALTGRKGESLFYLSSMDVPIPDFFVITPSVYRNFLLLAFDKKLSKLLEKIKDPDIRDLEKIISTTDFPLADKEELVQAYSRLSGFSNAWVAVRSSVVYPQDRSVTFSGIFHTELSVKGVDQLLDAIKKVYLSVFRDRVLLYAREKGVDLTEMQMAVVVQRMVQPEVSGITYTLDPITKDRKRMSIEAVFGLGDVITDGAITPDLYTLQKKDLSFIEKHISPQEWMRIRKPADRKVGTGDPYQKIPITKTWSHQQKIEDNYIRDIAKVSLIVEEKSKHPQLIEWAWESGNVWILQNKVIVEKEEVAANPIPAPELKSVYDIALDIVKDEQQARKQVETMNIAEKVLSDQVAESQGFTTEEATIQAATDADLTNSEPVKTDLDEQVESIETRLQQINMNKEIKEEKVKVKQEKKDQARLEKKGLTKGVPTFKMEFLLSGIGVSTGKITGKIVKYEPGKGEIPQITKSDILLLSKFTPETESLIMRSGGVIMDEGGLTSDASILCREIEIPAITGTGLATAILEDGDHVMIDGNVGSIYRYNSKLNEEVKPDTKKVKEPPESSESSQIHLGEVKEVSNLTPALLKDQKVDSSEPEAPKPKKEKPRTATKVLMFPRRGSRPSEYLNYNGFLDGICYVDMDGLMIDDGRYPLAYLEEKKFSAYSKQLELLLDSFAELDQDDEVIVSVGSATVGEMKGLVKGKEYESKELDDSVSGVQRLLNNPKLLKKQIEIIKKIRNTYNNRNVSLAIHSPVNKELLSKIKREFSAGGLKRSGSFNIYPVIDSTSELILLDEIISSGIDGVIVNTPLLAMQMQGLSRNQENAKYNIGVNSVWNVLKKVIDDMKHAGVKSFVLAEDNKVLIKNCVNEGVYAVSVYPEDGEELKQYVSEQETKMIMNMS